MQYIIGNGLSGLSAAYFSKEDNIVFGSDDSRILTLKTKLSIDVGAQFFSKNDQNLFDLTKNLLLENSLKETTIDKLSMQHKQELFKINDNFSELNEVMAKKLNEFKTFLSKSDELLEKMPKELFETNFNKWYKKNFDKDTIWFIDSLLKSITFIESKDVCAFYGIIACQSFFTKTYTFEKGLSEIINKLKEKTKVESAEVRQISFSSGNATIFFDKNEKISKNGDKIISAIPSNKLAKILEEKELANVLKKMPYAGCSVLVANSDAPLTKKTNGIIFSKKQKISAILKNEEYYTILAPYKKDQTAPNQKILLNELKKITNNDNIEITCFKNWDYGLPTCSPKMFKYQQKIIEITNQYDNFAICGDFMGLPSLDACVESAKKAVLKIEKNNP